MNRRTLLSHGALAATTTLLAARARASDDVKTAANATHALDALVPFAPGAHAPKPLPFDAKSLRGLSEHLLTSHHDNNYVSAIKNLNVVEQQLAAVTKDTPAFVVGALRERELTFTNSMVLHELYFENLGGDGKRAGDIEAALSRVYGASSSWEEQFRALALSLAGGSGWAVLELCTHTRTLRSTWAGNHKERLATGIPLLVLDVYEHAYAIDHGAACAKYIDAFMANVRWDVVDARLQRALQRL